MYFVLAVELNFGHPLLTPFANLTGLIKRLDFLEASTLLRRHQLPEAAVLLVGPHIPARVRDKLKQFARNRGIDFYPATGALDAATFLLEIGVETGPAPVVAKNSSSAPPQDTNRTVAAATAASAAVSAPIPISNGKARVNGQTKPAVRSTNWRQNGSVSVIPVSQTVQLPPVGTFVTSAPVASGEHSSEQRRDLADVRTMRIVRQYNEPTYRLRSCLAPEGSSRVPAKGKGAPMLAKLHSNG